MYDITVGYQRNVVHAPQTGVTLRVSAYLLRIIMYSHYTGYGTLSVVAHSLYLRQYRLILLYFSVFVRFEQSVTRCEQCV